MTSPLDRRQSPRLTAGDIPWQPMALLRPGQDVLLINVSRGGALVESPTRMSPGAKTELQLAGERKQSIRARIGRCYVASLAPMRYHGVVIFEEHLEVEPPGERVGPAGSHAGLRG